jgi:hypothetical protein
MVYAFSKGNPQVDKMTVMQVINDGVFFGGQALTALADQDDVAHLPMFRARPAPLD